MTNRRGAVLGLLMFGGGLMLALLLSAGSMAGVAGSPPGGGEPAASPSPGTCSTVEAIQDDLLGRGFKIRDFSIDDVVWSQNPLDNTGGAFHGRIETREELSKFLRGDAPRSRAARYQVFNEILNDERDRALTGEGYTPVQFHTAVDYTGNTVWDDEHVITPDGVKRAKSGDVVWVYTTRACDVVWSASIRADCGNVGYHRLVPVRED